ncbi:GNAT family N-acetyltransferase [Exiguobacterium antarcticum]|uniref:GNAT family N-acetyltransferase n=1 Tax=Exiguobacterium antarcticum TaxID=132920 RepID=A0ABT6R2M5_9BACL|nr:GNAT family N-acetyltransferase [Exiguobacterium antarcticum]MDI3235200.1 GNAT family N-acetyltransferase [Exiguobacterium antarcticum]
MEIIETKRHRLRRWQESDAASLYEYATERVIGSFGFHDRRPVMELADLKQVEFGFVLHPDYWGQGRMPEIVRTALEVAFKTMEVDLVWCAHFDFNSPSRRVIEKLGFEHVSDRPFVMERIDGRTVTSRLYRWTRERYEGQSNGIE